MMHDLRSDKEEFAKLRSREQTFIVQLREKNFKLNDMVTVREEDERSRLTDAVAVFKVKSISGGDCPSDVVLELCRCECV
jgi:hypothetical protein